MTSDPVPVDLFPHDGHHAPVDARVAALPDSPAAMKRPAYRVWCALRAYGPLIACCGTPRGTPKCRTSSCCLDRVLNLEHSMDEPAVARAIRAAIDAGWVRVVNGRLEHRA